VRGRERRRRRLAYFLHDNGFGFFWNLRYIVIIDN